MNRPENPVLPAQVEGTSYADGEYWQLHSTFHEEDADFKVANSLRLLDRQDLVSSIGSVLDIGCGSGEFLRKLAPSVDADLTGIDLAVEAIDRAESLSAHNDIEFRRGSFDDLDERFDLVVLNDVFEHVEDYVGFLRAVRSAGSMHCFHIPLDMSMLSLARHRYMNARRNLGHLHYFTEYSALATLELSGFDVIDSHVNSGAALAVRNRRGIKATVAAGPRLLAHRVNPSFSATWLGGATLSVLARPRHD